MTDPQWRSSSLPRMSASGLDAAEQHLLELIRAGDEEGWRQFVLRFERRLLAFATTQVGDRNAAEDLVQETFVAFLQGMSRFRSQCTLETFLFRVLRFRIADFFRKKGRSQVVLVCGLLQESDAAAPHEPVSRDPSASLYIRNLEHQSQQQQQLEDAIWLLATQLQSKSSFRDLKIAELLFLGAQRNVQIAQRLEITEAEVAVVKHRLLKRLKQTLSTADSEAESGCEPAVPVLPEMRLAWENCRPCCPKRSTLGKYVLGILPDTWNDFVRFHVEAIACRYCIANLEELSAAPPVVEAGSNLNAQQIFRSTVGFLMPDRPAP